MSLCNQRNFERAPRDYERYSKAIAKVSRIEYLFRVFSRNRPVSNSQLLLVKMTADSFYTVLASFCC